MKTVLIAGGSGMIGKALSKCLRDKGFNVIILSRKKKQRGYLYWNPISKNIEGRSLNKINVLVNLIGENIGDKKWTENRKKELIESRVNTTTFLFNSRINFPNLEYYVGASGINCYGFKDGNTLHTEADHYGEDFLANLIKLWEECSSKFMQHMPGSILRIASVMDNTGGVLSKMKTPVYFGLGSPLGSGKQLLPWIHVEDLCEMIVHCIENKLNGTYNAVASCDPNKEIMRTLAKSMHRPFFMPNVPSKFLKWIYGERSELILRSVNASNEKIISTGFNFKYPTIQQAFMQLLSKK